MVSRGVWLNKKSIELNRITATLRALPRTVCQVELFSFSYNRTVGIESSVSDPKNHTVNLPLANLFCH